MEIKLKETPLMEINVYKCNSCSNWGFQIVIEFLLLLFEGK